MENNKCLSCPLSTFGNLHHKIAELEGGELFVLEESIEQKKLLPCQPLYPLDYGLIFGRECMQLWKKKYITIIR